MCFRIDLYAEELHTILMFNPSYSEFVGKTSKTNLIMLKKFSCLFMAMAVLNLSVFAGTPLRRGTMVLVRTQSEITSKNVSNTLNAIVDSDVKASDGTIVISRGTPVMANMEVKKAKGVGKPGEIAIKSMSTTSVDGQHIYLNGSVNEEGESKKGKALGLGLGLGLLVFLPFIGFLGKKGGQAKIPAGTVFTQFSTADDYQIEK